MFFVVAVAVAVAIVVVLIFENNGQREERGEEKKLGAYSRATIEKTLVQLSKNSCCSNS